MLIATFLTLDCCLPRLLNDLRAAWRICCLGLAHSRPSVVDYFGLLSFFLTAFFLLYIFYLRLPSHPRLRWLSRGFLRVGRTCCIAAFTSGPLAHAFGLSVRDSASTVASAHVHAL